MLIKNRILWAVIIIVSLICTACPTAVSAEKPDLVLEQVSLSSSTISKGDTFTASFVLRNNTLTNLRNVYLQVPSADFSVVGKGSSFLAAELIKPDTPVEISLKLECHDVQSNKIPLQFSYEKYTSESLTMNEQLLVTFKDTPKESCTPAFSITEGEIQTVGIGSTRELSIIVKNVSRYEAENVSIIPVMAENLMTDILFNQVTMEPGNTSLKPGEEKNFKFSLTVNGITAPGIYPITYGLQCRNMNNEAVTSSLAGYIKVTESKTFSDILISGVTITPEVPVRGKQIKITVNIANRYEQKINNLKIWLEGLPPESFRSCEEQQEKTPIETDAAAWTAEFDYNIARQTPDGTYPYDICISYTDPLGNSIQNKDRFLLNLQPEEVKTSTLEIRNKVSPSQEVLPDNKFTAGFDICNTGENDIEDLEITFSGSGQILSCSNSGISVDRLSAGEVKNIEIQLIASKQQQTINLPITFTIRYDAAEGDTAEIKTLEQSMVIKVKGVKEDISQPKLVISDVKMPDIILKGEPFDFGFTLCNTSQEKSVRNIKITASSVDPVSQTTNIIILGQSDSIYIPELTNQEKAGQKLSLEIPDTFQGTVCSVRFDLTYEDSEGIVYTDEEVIQLPVAELTQLTASDVRIGSVREDGYTLELDFYNTGSAVLKNLMVDLEGDFEAVNSNYYVGDLQSGRMDIYSVAINGGIPDKINGNVVFTYEDSAGSEKEITVPFNLSYTAPVVETAAPEAIKKPAFPYKVAFAGCSLTGLIMIMLIRKKKKAVL